MVIILERVSKVYNTEYRNTFIVYQVALEIFY